MIGWLVKKVRIVVLTGTSFLPRFSVNILTLEKRGMERVYSIAKRKKRSWKVEDGALYLKDRNLNCDGVPKRKWAFLAYPPPSR